MASQRKVLFQNIMYNGRNGRMLNFGQLTAFLCVLGLKLDESRFFVRLIFLGRDELGGGTFPFFFN